MSAITGHVPYVEEQTDLGLKVTFPTGDSIFYVDDTHRYYKVKPDEGRGKQLPSVSGLVKPFDYDPALLMRWAAKKQLEGVAFMARQIDWFLEPEVQEPPPWLEDAELMWTRLEEKKLTYNDLREAKATTGKNVHTAMEELAAAPRRAPDFDSYPESERGYVKALWAWWMSHNYFTVLNSEQFVYSAKHGYAGRFDLRCEIEGELVLVDLKTSGYLTASMQVQLAGYNLAAYECGVGASDRQMVLQVRDDGTYNEVWSEADNHDFLDALSVCRRAKELKAALKGSRK